MVKNVQNIFFPPNFSFVFWKRQFWREKKLLYKEGFFVPGSHRILHYGPRPQFFDQFSFRQFEKGNLNILLINDCIK
jgi:hypothetical protein